ncbi:hypothetical protein Taro_008399 [Colocasia esculenta]|uniref:Uncharacterized protein n=1 Tax=Colocasia esculenta TaxID=4460 RepID=A0A843U6W9_COLES|nr:hypothetical protein [Colocasia esculenta]
MQRGRWSWTLTLALARFTHENPLSFKPLKSHSDLGIRGFSPVLQPGPPDLVLVLQASVRTGVRLPHLLQWRLVWLWPKQENATTKLMG